MHAAADRSDGWNDEDDRTLVQLRAQGMAWNEIAFRINRFSTKCVNRTANACSGRYAKLLPREARRRIYNSGDRWTKEDEQKLDALLRQRKKPGEIAIILGKRTRSVHNKINYIRNPRQVAEIDMQTRVWAPPHLFEDRDRRERAERDITSAFFGDPPKGWSALDKKQGAFA